MAIVHYFEGVVADYIEGPSEARLVSFPRVGGVRVPDAASVSITGFGPAAAIAKELGVEDIVEADAEGSISRFYYLVADAADEAGDWPGAAQGLVTEALSEPLAVVEASAGIAQSLRTLMKHGPAATGLLMHRPVLVVVYEAGVFIMWFARPTVERAREVVAEEIGELEVRARIRKWRADRERRRERGDDEDEP